ncbi:MAG: CDP-alcohol phosphatidyltransferase family protein [Nanoarchaeota archaeon]|nr:CDP-alcohol phosphatidyltransferase family protein [Nanoarchaeota archaeon]MBU1644557.1 CDP-alcohol phosphatidyltransferase family protein [Nanoarchaeota archaeon]MBU1976850.1 CDP-alcohol phosphatidyltransferase family protein [Nanoarchaeota archaeon]
MEVIEKSRKFRTKKFSGTARRLHQLGISANMMTSLSLLFGLTAIFFLFSNYVLFVLFAILHLLADGLDGLIARISKTSEFGKYFDLSTDSLITFLILIKLGWYLQDYYPYFVAGLFLVTVMIHLLSKAKSPIYFLRTTYLGTLIIILFPLMPTKITLLIGSYFIAGAIVIYSLVKEISWLVNKRNRFK